MGFFARGKDEDGEQAEALARIEAGGIPPRARGAVAGARHRGLVVHQRPVGQRVRAARTGSGREPLAQVMGASVVRPGWQYLPALEPGEVVIGGRYGSGYGPIIHGMALPNRMTEASPSQIRNYKWHAAVVCELDVLTDAWNLARRRALDRLAEEALQVGADAVVGVRLQRSDHDLGKGLIECIVTGTAIRDPGRRPERPGRC